MLLGLLATAAALAAGPEMIPADAMEVVGQPAPDFTVPTMDGATFQLSKHRGHVVVISFFASWCGPCRNELPALSDMVATNKTADGKDVAKTLQNVEFVAVNVDRNKPDAEKFLKQVHVGVPVAWDNDSQALGQYMVLSMPTTFVIDAKGVVRYKKIGYSTEKGFTELLADIDGAKAAK